MEEKIKPRTVGNEVDRQSDGLRATRFGAARGVAVIGVIRPEISNEDVHAAMRLDRRFFPMSSGGPVGASANAIDIRGGPQW
jgi:hypothetical protein